MTSDFPPTSCTAWEDCNHDGLCHEPKNCGGIGPNSHWFAETAEAMTPGWREQPWMGPTPRKGRWDTHEQAMDIILSAGALVTLSYEEVVLIYARARGFIVDDAPDMGAPLTKMQPPAGETIRTTQDGSMEAPPETGQSPVGAVSTDAPSNVTNTSAWQAMESAPKDGRNVLLCFHHHPVAIGRFEYGSWTYAFCVTEGGDSPTGWMPVPEKDRPNIAAEYTEGDATPCKSCKGTGTMADYVGDDMRCVEVGCSLCNGTGRAAQPETKQPAGDGK